MIDRAALPGRPEPGTALRQSGWVLPRETRADPQLRLTIPRTSGPAKLPGIARTCGHCSQTGTPPNARNGLAAQTGSRRTTPKPSLTLFTAALLLAPLAGLHGAEFSVADIAPSAYRYRADRRAEENAPESWLAVMRYAGQPLNQPADPNSPAVKRVLCALLWEEIRPIRQVELTWAGDPMRRPAPEVLEITTLDNQGSASSWWNNLKAEKKPVEPALADGGSTLVYNLSHPTCGLVVSVGGDRLATDYAVPAVRVLVADTWKKMDLEIEWGYEAASAQKDYSGRIETYDGIVGELAPLEGDAGTTVGDHSSWRSAAKAGARRGVKASLLYLGTSKWRKAIPFTSQPEDVARTIVTVWSKSGNFSFLAADLEHGPILAPEYGFFVRRTSALPAPAPAASAAAVGPHTPPFDMASRATSASEFVRELQERNLSTIRQRLRPRPERTWQEAVTAMRGSNLPPHPAPPAGSEPAMQVQVPCERLTAQWNLGRWHLTRHCVKNPENGRLRFNDHPYGILAAETYMILAALDLMGDHQAAEDGFHQWVSLPMQPLVENEKQAPNRGYADDKHHGWALPDRPNGLFTEGRGCLTHAEGPPGAGGHMDGVHAFGPGSIGWALVEHYRLTGDQEWFKAHAPRIRANVEWMLRQRRTVQNIVPGGERLWCKGLQPALQVTPDSGGLWMQFYEAEAYYWVAVRNFAEALATIDPSEGARLRAEAEAYRKDLWAAVERTIALSPVVPIRDGTYRSVIPFACYVRGLSTGAWGWRRDGSGGHVGPMYWETVQSAAALISPAGVLAPEDVRVQGYLDVLEDRLLLENLYVKEHAERDWLTAGWQYQGGLERTSNMHLAGDDVPVFIRSFLNGYAVDVLPGQGYIFNEHAVHGPPDKIYEEACFLERFRNLLVMEEGQRLWLARATPRAWLEQGKKISVKNAPTHFGTVAYEIVPDVDNRRIEATVEMPARNPPKSVLLRFRHPTAARIQSVEVNGKPWRQFNIERETIDLGGLTRTVVVTANY